MSQTTPTDVSAPITTQRGFPGLPCLACGEVDCLSLDLADLDTLHCSSCEVDTTVSAARAAVDVWQRVLAWIDMLPTS